MLTAQHALSPYTTQIQFVFKGLRVMALEIQSLLTYSKMLLWGQN